MDNMQEAYQQYAFLPDPAVSGESPAGIGAPANSCETNASVTSNMYNLIERTYEDPFYWYYVVFSPLDKAYIDHYDWFQVKGLSKCRDFFQKPDTIILTRELNAKKTHINVLVCTQYPVSYRKSKIYTHKYFAHVQRIDDGLAGRTRVLNYMLKECKTRTFLKWLDYITYQRTLKL